MKREGELRRQQAIERINRHATPLQLLGCKACAASQRERVSAYLRYLMRYLRFKACDTAAAPRLQGARGESAPI
jgi:hypothetical protein